MMEEIKGIEQPKETPESTENLLDKSVRAAAELRAANAEKKELLDREERLHAARLLGGRSEAGIQQPPPKVESPVDYKNRIMRGDLNVKDRRV